MLGRVAAAARSQGPLAQRLHTAITPVRWASTSTAASSSKPPTAIVMMNLGGPSHADEVHPFLLRLFSDREIIQLPVQRYLSRWIAKRRTPKIIDQYNQIGGGSPIRMWTETQGRALVEQLDKLCPDTAPHKFYVAFRYASPLTDDALEEMRKDGVKRAIAFTQYPQYSCTTTGSSLNELYRALQRHGMAGTIDWSVIDRWHSHPGLVQAFAKRIREGLEHYPPEQRGDVVILFSAHSVPLYVVNRGDPYPKEVAGTVNDVMKELHYSNPYRLVWQSKVGPLPWLGPQTGDVLAGFAEKGRRNILVVPIAFTSDHVETLFEIDLEYGHMAKELGLTGFRRVESLNADPTFLEAMADVVAGHLRSGKACSRQMHLRCPGCTNHYCGDSKAYFGKQPAKLA
eukprot:tig00020816_g14091.t1